MFIDTHFSEIVEQLSYEPDAEEAKLQKSFYIDVLDGISAVSMNGLYDTSLKSGNWSVSFPNKRLWFEEIGKHVTYGILYTRITNDIKERQKDVLRHIKKVKQGKLSGYFTKRKPSFVGVTSIELLRMVASDENTSALFFGMVMRLITAENKCKDFVIATEPDATFSDFAFEALIKVIEAQRTINNTKTIKTPSDETAHLHLPNSNKDIDFEYKIVTIKPGTTEAFLRKPNFNGGGWKQSYEHTRRGTWRKLHNPEWVGRDKQGRKIVRGWTWVDAYTACSGKVKEVHKDYKL